MIALPAPKFAMGEFVKLTKFGVKSLVSAHRAKVVEPHLRCMHDETLRLLQKGLEITVNRGVIVGVFLNYGKFLGQATDASYLAESSTGPSYRYQVLFQWSQLKSRKKDEFDERCFAFEFGQFDLEINEFPNTGTIRYSW